MVQFSHEEARVTSLEMDLPAVHRVLVRVSVLHNISGSVDLLPRRDVMVSVNSDCFSGSAASSGKKNTFQNWSHSKQQLAALLRILCWSMTFSIRTIFALSVKFDISYHLINSQKKFSNLHEFSVISLIILI